MPLFHKETARSLAPYFCISAALLIVFVMLGYLQPQQVGDGSEYYGLFCAWDAAHRPWMTSMAYDVYERLYSSGSITGMVPRESLENRFPTLKIGSTADFNHFWLYSFLAFICSKAASLIGIKLQVHESFLMLHYLLLLGTSAISFLLFKWRGLSVVLLMTFVSPMLWFLDKVHTELFTYCLVLSSVICIYAKKYLPATLLLALASAQNPSFALVAFIPLFFRVVLQRKKPYSFIEVIVFVATVLTVLAHPVYYFLRLGVLTPQLLAGGASLGQNLSSFYIWIIDPDLGLLPNWPLGMCALLLALGIWGFRKNRVVENVDFAYGTFLLLYLCINLYAHSSTQNINSGATPGLARYATWYLPLAFPVLYKLSAFFSWQHKGLYLLLPAVAALTLFSVNTNYPSRPEAYTTPSRASLLIQTQLPWLYNPPEEVFIERYSGLGESVAAASLVGVLGPDCRKLLLMPGDGQKGVSSIGQCFFEAKKLNAYAKSLAANIDSPTYVSLNDADASNLAVELSSDIYKVGAGANGNFILGSGWSNPEDWGVWSQGSVATFVIPCGTKQRAIFDDGFSLSLKVRPFGKQYLKISGSGDILWQGDVDGSNVNFDVPAKNCANGLSELTVNISNPTSPFELGVSSDGRKLGVGIIEFQIKGR